jgi:hypothetical protein
MLALDRGDDIVTSTKEEILAAVGEEDIGALTFIILALEEVVGQQSPHVLKG